VTIPGKPIGKHVLVLRDAPVTATGAGVQIPEAGQDIPRRGAVVALGSEVSDFSEEIKIGTRLLWLYSLPSDVEITVGADTYVVLHAHDIALIDLAEPE
jgi:co-chaperonin GroES (HSP10)